MKLTADEKRVHVETFLDSGLNAEQYAKLSGIPRTNLQRWVMGDGLNGRAPHPKRYAFENLLAEGFSAWKAALVLGLHKSTVRYWMGKK